ncbi:MAG: PhzF family phenazine biosynthesis protein [Betaproteobacteria bacterium]
MTAQPARVRRFTQLDVFSSVRTLGNPLAVVLDGQGLSAEQMQAFANWTNLSETTFLLPPDTDQADYRVRIFSPGRELPFAGHPTLGSCHAWLSAGGRPQRDLIIQQCQAGLIAIRQSGERLWFAAPPRLRDGPRDEAEVVRIASGLRIPRKSIIAHSWCDNGPRWRGVLLGSAAEVLALEPDPAILEGLDLGVIGARGKVGVVAPADAAAEVDFEVRAFFTAGGSLREDPVTGSLNAALAQWLIGEAIAPARYVARQGTRLGRDGRVYIEQTAPDTVWVGGYCTECIRGELTL